MALVLALTRGVKWETGRAEKGRSRKADRAPVYNFVIVHYTREALLRARIAGPAQHN